MVDGLIFLTIWAMLPLFWHFLLRGAGLSLLRPTIPSFVIAAFYVFQYIGLPILYFKLDEYVAFYVTDQSLVLKIFLYTSITITLMLVGFIAGRNHFGGLSLVQSREPGTPAVEPGGAGQTAGLFVLIALCTAVLLSYVSKVGFQRVALVVALSSGNDSLSVAAARSAMGNAFEGKYHWYSLFMRDLLSFAAFALFAQYLAKRTFAVLCLLLLTCAVAAFSLLMATEKAPIANFIVALFLVFVFVRREGRFPIVGLVLLGAAILATLAVTYIFFMGSQNLVAGATNTISRTFTGQIHAAYHYLEFFPAVHDFLMGRSLPNPRGMLPFDPYLLTTELTAWFFPEHAEAGIVGSMPTVYWGEMYANFGVWGVLVPPFFVGYALYWINAAVFRLRPTPLSVALTVWLMLHFMVLSGSSLSNFLMDNYVAGILMAFAALGFFVGGGLIRLKCRGQMLMERSTSGTCESNDQNE